MSKIFNICAIANDSANDFSVFVFDKLHFVALSFGLALDKRRFI